MKGEKERAREKKEEREKERCITKRMEGKINLKSKRWRIKRQSREGEEERREAKKRLNERKRGREEER